MLLSTRLSEASRGVPKTINKAGGEHAVEGEVRPCEKTRSMATEVASICFDLYLVLWNEA
jgi:hypothetical protein